ncbi:MAG TPA: hypothetical protein VFW22_08140 [Pseudolabrys sp.]|nr:hypothetical protein [Pseudolabrys sp.]
MSTVEPASIPPPPPRPPAVSDTQLAFAVYVLYLVGFFTAITALVGVIIAYAQVDKADDMLRTHYRFQIRTFWIGLVYVVIGALSAIVIVGFFILLWWFIWTLVRCVKGLLALNEGRPIANPGSWLFG